MREWWRHKVNVGKAFEVENLKFWLGLCTQFSFVWYKIFSWCKIIGRHADARNGILCQRNQKKIDQKLLLIFDFLQSKSKYFYQICWENTRIWSLDTIFHWNLPIYKLLICPKYNPSWMREIKSRRNQFRFQFQTALGLLFIIKLFKFSKKKIRTSFTFGFDDDGLNLEHAFLGHSWTTTQKIIILKNVIEKTLLKRIACDIDLTVLCKITLSLSRSLWPAVTSHSMVFIFHGYAEMSRLNLSI